jgi:hypothetical protein
MAYLGSAADIVHRGKWHEEDVVPSFWRGGVRRVV